MAIAVRALCSGTVAIVIASAVRGAMPIERIVVIATTRAIVQAARDSLIKPSRQQPSPYTPSQEPPPRYTPAAAPNDQAARDAANRRFAPPQGAPNPNPPPAPAPVANATATRPAARP